MASTGEENDIFAGEDQCDPNFLDLCKEEQGLRFWLLSFRVKGT